MIILVPSVHHTGTNTVFRSVLSELDEINQQDYTKGHGKIRIHIDKAFIENGDLEYWLERVPAIVPMRHPIDVARSWKVRGKKFRWLENQWNWLKEVIDPYEPYYLPLDRSDRDSWLRKINLDLETDFTTDWPTLASEGPYLKEQIEFNVEDEVFIEAWMEDGFFDKFGYSLDGGIH